MRKKINGVLYDTATASLTTETESMTILSGRLSVRLYKSQGGQWFQISAPINGNDKSSISNRISPNTARGDQHEFRRLGKIFPFKIPDSIATPCSVKAMGKYLEPPQLEVPNWDLKLLYSSFVNSNIKSSGKRSICRLTFLFKILVSTS